MKGGSDGEPGLPGSDTFREVVVKRYDCLAALLDGPRYKRDLIEELDTSRSTVDRAIDDLLEQGLVETDNGRYSATTAGRLAADGYRQYRSELGDIEAAIDVLDALPDGTPADTAMIDSATIHRVDGQPQEALSRVRDALRAATEVEALLPRLSDSRMLDAYHSHATADRTTTTIVFASPLLATLRERFPVHLQAIADSGGNELYEGTVPSFGLVVTRGEVDAAYVIVYTEMSGIAAVLELTSARGLDWATDLVRDRVAAATDRTDRLALVEAAADPTHMPQTPTEDALPTALEAEGFVAVTDALFERRSHAPLLVSWRTGISLGGIAAGQAIERRLTTQEGEPIPVAAEVAERLGAGRDTVVIGPPGAGKSTVCRQVAVHWHDEKGEPVLYRAQGSGDAFESVAALRQELASRDGHVLVVVEDVPAAEARAVLETQAEYAGTDTVSFLFDARSRDWDRLRSEASQERSWTLENDLETYEMPSLSVAECELLLERAADRLGEPLAIDATELYESASQSDRSGTGDFFVAVHHLARLADPLHAAEGAPSTTLSVSAREILDGLRSRGQRAVDVGVLVNLLNVCGVTVDPALVYALGEAEAVDRAVEVLDGVALFSTSAKRGLASAPGTVHETWADAFFDHLLDVYGTHASRESLSRCLSSVFALSDADTRDLVTSRLGDSSPALAEIEADPVAWRESLVERLFEGLRDRPRLGPLVDERVLDSVPAAVQPLQRYRWLGQLAIDAGDPDQAAEAFETLRDLATEQGNTRFRAAAAYGLGQTALEQARYGDADEYLSTALGLANQGNYSSLATDALLQLGVVAEKRGDLDTAEKRLTKARARAEAAGDEFTLAKCLQNLGVVGRMRSAYETADERGQAALDIYERLEEPGWASRVLSNLGNSKKNQGDYEAAASYYRRALDIDVELGQTPRMAATLTNLGDLERSRGNSDRAETYTERAISLYRRIGDDARLAIALNNLGIIRKNAGDLTAARAAHEEAYEIRQAIGNPHEVGMSEHNLGVCAREDGDLDAAERWLHDSIGHLSEADNIRAVALTRAELATVFAEAGDEEAALSALERAVEELEGCGAMRDAASVQHDLAERLTEAGRVEEAHGHARRSRALLADLE